MLWPRKAPNSPIAARGAHIGTDLTSSRVLAVATGNDQTCPLALDGANDTLPLVLSLEGRTPQVGAAGVALVRRLPHLVCQNFLVMLGQNRQWRAGRHAITADAALRLVFEQLRSHFSREADAVALALPMYLSPLQVERVIETAHKTNWPLKGTVAAPLALVADRARGIATRTSEDDEPDEPTVMPLHPQTGRGAVVVIDADEFAVHGSVVAVEADQVRLLQTAAWPRLGRKIWMDRLVDGVSDRCVRLCRRDPRDSAEAEQSLFEQLLVVLDPLTPPARIKLTLRTASWYQDVLIPPGDLAEFCAPLVQGAVEDVQGLLAAVRLPQPPRAIWLTHEAGRLPGLSKALHANSMVSTAIEVLPPRAAATATARLVPRWLSGELPRTHIDASLPLPPFSSSTPRMEPSRRTALFRRDAESS